MHETTQRQMSDIDFKMKDSRELEEMNDQKNDAYKNDFTDRYVDLKNELSEAEFISENKMNVKDILKSLHKEYIDRNFVSQHRDVFSYKDTYILKTTEKDEEGKPVMSTDMALELQKNLFDKYPNVPIVRTIGVIKDEKTDTEYLIEPKGKMFSDYYKENKDSIKDEEFIKMLEDFVEPFERYGCKPAEFNYKDFDKHLVLEVGDSGYVLKMVDVDKVFDMNNIEKEEIKSIPNEFIKYLKVKENIANNVVQTEIKNDQLQIIKKKIEKYTHDIKSPITSLSGLNDLLLKMPSEEVVKMYNSSIHNTNLKRNLIPHLFSSLKELYKEQTRFLTIREKDLLNDMTSLVEESRTLNEATINIDNNKKFNEHIKRIVGKIEDSEKIYKYKYNNELIAPIDEKNCKKPWYQIENIVVEKIDGGIESRNINKHIVLGSRKELQERVDKINILFEFKILPKINPETHQDLQALLISNEVNPKLEQNTNDYQKKVKNLLEMSIKILDKWNKVKDNPPATYINVSSLLNDLVILSRSTMGEYDNNKKINEESGLVEDDNDIIKAQIKNKLRESKLID